LELELVRERANNQRLQINNLRLQKLLERLQAEVEELQRAGKRQAAPFARRKRVEHPKKPGRKAAEGDSHGEKSLDRSKSKRRNWPNWMVARGVGGVS